MSATPPALLRQALHGDIAAMHRVRLAVRENRLTSSALGEADYVAEIETNGRGWVIQVQREIVAFAVGNARTHNIWALFVAPGHEGQGFGRRLHDTMVEWLFDQGLERLWLSTGPGTRAQRFYAAAGWSFRRVLPSGEHHLELERRPAAR